MMWHRLTCQWCDTVLHANGVILTNMSKVWHRPTCQWCDRDLHQWCYTELCQWCHTDLHVNEFSQAYFSGVTETYMSVVSFIFIRIFYNKVSINIFISTLLYFIINQKLLTPSDLFSMTIQASHLTGKKAFHHLTKYLVICFLKA